MQSYFFAILFMKITFIRIFPYFGKPHFTSDKLFLTGTGYIVFWDSSHNMYDVSL